MGKLFLSKLPKSVSAGEVEEFVRSLFPSATHIQLVMGSSSGEHKGHAYAHFADEAAAAEAMRQVSDHPPSLHGHDVLVKMSVHPPESSLAEPLPPQLAHCPHGACAWFSPPAAADAFDGVVARHDTGGASAVAFDSEAKAAAAISALGGAKCLPPLLPDLLSSQERPLCSGSTIVEMFEQRGFVSLTPTQALTIAKELMEGRGRVAVRDRAGNVAVMTLPAHATALQ